MGIHFQKLLRIRHTIMYKNFLALCFAINMGCTLLQAADLGSSASVEQTIQERLLALEQIVGLVEDKPSQFADVKSSIVILGKTVSRLTDIVTNLNRMYTGENTTKGDPNPSPTPNPEPRIFINNTDMTQFQEHVERLYKAIGLSYNPDASVVTTTLLHNGGIIRPSGQPFKIASDNVTVGPDDLTKVLKNLTEQLHNLQTKSQPKENKTTQITDKIDQSPLNIYNNQKISKTKWSNEIFGSVGAALTTQSLLLATKLATPIGNTIAPLVTHLASLPHLGVIVKGASSLGVAVYPWVSAYYAIPALVIVGAAKYGFDTMQNEKEINFTQWGWKNAYLVASKFKLIGGVLLGGMMLGLATKNTLPVR
jgi:hypothetical protein